MPDSVSILLTVAALFFVLMFYVVLILYNYLLSSCSLFNFICFLTHQCYEIFQ